MGLLDRSVPQNARINEQANTKRDQSPVSPKESKKKLTAQERKNIKVSPETLNLVKAICTMKSMKNYEFVDEAVEFYIKNNMSDREQRILKNLNKR